MLLHVAWVRRDSGAGDAYDREILSLLEKWEPAAEMTIHAWVERIDGQGGYGLVEADSAEAVTGAVVFNPYFAFTVNPVIQHADMVKMLSDAVSLRGGSV